MKGYALFLIAIVVLVGCRKEEDTPTYTEDHATVTDVEGKYREDCLPCHNFTYAGTVWDTTDGNPLPNVKVVIKSLTSSDSLVLTTDSFGNFYTESSLPDGGYEAYVDCGLIRRMPVGQTYGGCNDCHKPGGAASRVIVCR